MEMFLAWRAEVHFEGVTCLALFENSLSSVRRSVAASQLAPGPGQLIFLTPPRAFECHKSFGLCRDFDLHRGLFSNVLKRPKKKSREFSHITRYLHLLVLALRMQ